jgi:hypothetical protein
MGYILVLVAVVIGYVGAFIISAIVSIVRDARDHKRIMKYFDNIEKQIFAEFTDEDFRAIHKAHTEANFNGANLSRR